MKQILSSLLFVSVLSCCEPRNYEQSSEEWVAMHSEILDDLLEQRYFLHCLDKPLDDLNIEYAQEQFDSIQFLRKIDSLKEEGKRDVTKCEIGLDQQLRNGPREQINKDWLLRIPFYKENFGEYSNEQLLDSVAEPSRISAYD